MSRKEVKGPKFGRDLLNLCKQNKIPTSSFIVLIISLYECDQETGRLNKPQLTHWAEITGICYETLHYGWNILLEKNIILEDFEHQLRFKINRYRELTFQEDGKGNGYFRVPIRFMMTDFFSQLLKLKDWKSTWYALYILYRVSASPKGYSSTLEITMNQLKKDFERKDSYRIRKVLKALSTIYDITFLDKQHRGEQLHIRKVAINLKKRFISDSLDLEMRKIYGRVSRDVKQTLVNMFQIHLSKEELRDICQVFVQEVKRGKRAAKEILFHSLRSFAEEYIKRKESRDPIQNKAGYLRIIFREMNFRHIQKLDPFHQKTDIPILS